MNISQDHVVTLDYWLKDDNGVMIDSSEENGPLVYLHGRRQIIPGLEKQLEGKTTGDRFNAVIAPKDAYGERLDQLVQDVNREQLSQIQNLEEGMLIQSQSSDGVHVLKVLKIGEKSITLDGNHPLAGMTLYFDVKVLDIRLATKEEISHGHAHGNDDSHTHGSGEAAHDHKH